MDNVSFHKREDILQAIETPGHQVEFYRFIHPILIPHEFRTNKKMLYF